MDQLLHQLGGLVLGSVPTIVLFVLLVLLYDALVRRPLGRVLAGRRARTTGAVEQAKGAIAAAEAETSVYEDKLRGAKGEMFAERERRVKQWNDERTATLGEVREATQGRIEAAKRELEASSATARAQIDLTSNELTAKILTAVLPEGVTLQEVSQ